MTGYLIDLDPVHMVIRLTVTAETVTPELAQEMYTRLQEISSTHGEYAAIYDLTLVKGTTIEVEAVRSMARNHPAVLLRRPHLVVAEQQRIYGLARLYEMCREHIYGHFDVVETLEEAYKICGLLPEDFTQRIV